jgi:hypothetical protein
VIVLGAPMYNFSVPSQLKAWIDRIAQAGRVPLREGPRGLAGGKTLIIASSRGGRYADGAAPEALEHQESYLRAVFGFWASPTCASCAPRAWPWARRCASAGRRGADHRGPRGLNRRRAAMFLMRA